MGSKDKVVQELEKVIKDASGKKSEVEKYSEKIKMKADDLKDKLRDDLQLKDDDYMELLREADEYEQLYKGCRK